MAKRARTHRRSFRRRFSITRRAKKLPIALTLGVGGGLAISALSAANTAMTVNGNAAYKGAVFFDQLGQRIWGYSTINNQSYTGNMKQFWYPAGAGIAIHLLASKAGINRMLAKHLGFTL